MDTKQILQDSINDHQRAIDKAKKELEALNATYSIGDRFVLQGKKKVILANFKGCVGLIELETGRNWGQNYSSKVVDIHRITKREMGSIWGGDNTIRYWDNRKQVKV